MPHPSSISKYVYFDKASKKFKVQVVVYGRQQHVGSYETQEEAESARDAFLRGEIEPGTRKASEYGKYITLNKITGSYKVGSWKNRMYRHIGTFSNHADAIAARDAFMKGDNTNTNTSTSTSTSTNTTSVTRSNESTYGRYVYMDKPSGKFIVQFTKEAKLHRIGQFPTAEEAVAARDAYFRGETVINPHVTKESTYGKYIYHIKPSNKYEVRARQGGKLHYIGLFPTLDEAAAARDAFMKGETVIKPTQHASGMKRKRKQEDAPFTIRSHDVVQAHEEEEEEVVEEEEEEEEEMR